MAGVFVGGQSIKRAFVGTQPVKSIWVGDQKVWPTMTRQRINKSGNYTDGSYNPSPRIIPSWVSDSTYPASVDSHALRVSGGGSVSITAHIVFKNQFGNGSEAIQLRHNSTVVRSGKLIGNNDGDGTADWTESITVADGDTLSLWQESGERRTFIYAGTYIDVNPA